MRHKTAAQRGSDGWHYVSMGRTGGHPIGYCREHDPHPTEADARACYTRYLRDSIRLNASHCDWTSCAAGRKGETRCDQPTKDLARYGDDGYGVVPLCPAHMTIDGVVAAAGLWGPAGDAWLS